MIFWICGIPSRKATIEILNRENRKYVKPFHRANSARNLNSLYSFMLEIKRRMRLKQASELESMLALHF